MSPALGISLRSIFKIPTGIVDIAKRSLRHYGDNQTHTSDICDVRRFRTFSGHHNLMFLFDPLSIVADLCKTSHRKLQGWAIKFSAYDYTCVHIKGVEKVWADIFGRLSAAAVIRPFVPGLVLASSSATNFECLSSTEIFFAQSKHPPSDFRVWRSSTDYREIIDILYVYRRCCRFTVSSPHYGPFQNKCTSWS